MNNKSRTALHKRQAKDTKILLKTIRKTVEKGSGLSIEQLKMKYSQEDLFYTVLKYVSTTSRTVCEAFGIHQPSACKYKRKLEEQGFLVQSKDEIVCPFSGRMAYQLTTNESLFSELTKKNPNQLKMF